MADEDDDEQVMDIDPDDEEETHPRRNRRRAHPGAGGPIQMANYFSRFPMDQVVFRHLRTFSTTLRAYSVAMMPGQDKQNVENGGKIILPPSCLDQLTQLNTVYPMLFKITNEALGRESHCGVLEFIAEEGLCYLPHWMMLNLFLEEGDPIHVASVSLPVASFSKFQPQSVDFLDISNPKAMLENALRHFACLTSGDTIAIRYNDKIYDLKVLETQPGPAVVIIECDMDVDFAPPVGYVEPNSGSNSQASTPDAPSCSNYSPVPDDRVGVFGGSGNRLDGKDASSPEHQVAPIPTRGRGVPDYNYQVGSLDFVRDLSYFATQVDSRSPASSFQAFTGNGKLLRAPKVMAED